MVWPRIDIHIDTFKGKDLGQATPCFLSIRRNPTVPLGYDTAWDVRASNQKIQSLFEVTRLLKFVFKTAQDDTVGSARSAA